MNGDRYRAGKRLWSLADDATLREWYPHEPTAVLARVLRRTPIAVSARAGLLGLHKSAAYLASPAACRTNGRQGLRTRYPRIGDEMKPRRLRRFESHPVSTLRNKRDDAILNAVPTSWLDPLLTGPGAIIGRPPYDCRDIERVLNAVAARLRAALFMESAEAKDRRQ